VNSLIRQELSYRRHNFFNEWFGIYAGRELGNPERWFTDQPKDLEDHVRKCAENNLPCLMSVQPYNARDQPFGLEKIFFDFDSKGDLAKAWKEAKAFAQALTKYYNVHPFLAFSGSKGYHVYVFLESTVTFPTWRLDFVKHIYETLQRKLLNIVKQEVETLELSKEKQDDVQTLIYFLKKDSVEVRIYDKGFLHGKAYIFDNLVIIGSSNFTPSGLTYNTELNSVALEAEANYTRQKWFEKFWNESTNFKQKLITILENSRYGNKEYTPYEVYIKALYELQKEDIKPKDTHISTLLPESKVELTEFQQDAVDRIFSRLCMQR